MVGWIVQRPGRLDAHDHEQFQAILDRCPQLNALAAHVREFAVMMTGRHGQHLPDWLTRAAATVILDANRRGRRVPPLAGWSLGVGSVATVGANLAHGVGHGPIGALVSAWPALALVGSYELLMMLIRAESGTTAEPDADSVESHPAPAPRPSGPSPVNSASIAER
jgi:hypothetical protein